MSQPVSEVLDPVTAAVEAATTGVPNLHQLGQVPDEPDYPYSTFSAGLGRPDGYTLDRVHGMRWGQVVVQTFGRTVSSVNTQMELVLEQLLDQVLAIAGYDPTTPLAIELEPTKPTRDPDDGGVLGSTATLTFTATRS